MPFQKYAFIQKFIIEIYNFNLFIFSRLQQELKHQLFVVKTLGSTVSKNQDLPQILTLIPLINVEVGINMEGVQKMQNH